MLALQMLGAKNAMWPEPGLKDVLSSLKLELDVSFGPSSSHMAFFALCQLPTIYSNTPILYIIHMDRIGFSVRVQRRSSLTNWCALSRVIAHSFRFAGRLPFSGCLLLHPS